MRPNILYTPDMEVKRGPVATTILFMWPAMGCHVNLGEGEYLLGLLRFLRLKPQAMRFWEPCGMALGPAVALGSQESAQRR